MNEIYCSLCHEPWDAYGVTHGDMTSAEAIRFLNGEGCPICSFGEKCPHCEGLGKTRCELLDFCGELGDFPCGCKDGILPGSEDCPVCHGAGRLNE